MNGWHETTVNDLRPGVIFRFLDDEEDHVVRVQWSRSNGDVEFTSRTVATDHPDGLSVLRPSHPVLIRDNPLGQPCEGSGAEAGQPCLGPADCPSE